MAERKPQGKSPFRDWTAEQYKAEAAKAHAETEAAAEAARRSSANFPRNGEARRSSSSSAQQKPPDSWDDPLPLGDAPNVEPFPLNVFPTSIAQFLHEAAAALNCPVDYLAVPALVIAGAAIGASRALEIKPGWDERPTLYAAVVAPTGSAKSPAQKTVARPVYAQQSILHEDYQRRLAEWKDAGKEGARPVETIIYVSDVTAEKTAEVLQQNRRGIAKIEDELVAWVNRLDAYKSGKGADRQFYLSAWAGEPVSVLRKSQEDPIFVAHPFVSVTGGLPPSMLADLRGKRHLHDGFFEGILFAYPAPPTAVGEDWRCIEPTRANEWAATLMHLRDLQMIDGEGGKRPRYVRLTTSGRRSWEQFTNGLAAQLNDEMISESLRGNYAKMKGYAARLGLILHFLRHVHNEVGEEDVDSDSLDRAAQLVTYFQSHACKVYAIIDADEKIADARRVLRWLANSLNCLNSLNGFKTISRSELHSKVFGGRRPI
jgi:hypothetical protein